MLRLSDCESDAAMLIRLTDLSFDTLPEREIDCDMDIERDKLCERDLLCESD